MQNMQVKAHLCGFQPANLHSLASFASFCSRPPTANHARILSKILRAANTAAT